MAEVMISDRHRDSLQSLSLESLDSMKSDTLDQSSPSKNKEQKRVKHGPTTVIQIPEKRRKISTSSTTEQVVEGKIYQCCPHFLIDPSPKHHTSIK